MSALKQSGCDERVLLAEGPTEEQLRELCEALQAGRDNNTLGPQDAEFIAGLLGHFAWHSPELAKKVVEFGGAAAFASWIRMPDYIKQGHNPEDDHLIFPMFRACLTGISCVCRQGAANAQEVLKLDGVVDAALEFADHLERDVKRSALRVLARLMPYGAVSFDKVWRLIFKHILAGEDESVRAAAGACALQAATYGWDTEAPDLEGFAIAMHHGLEQALQGESPAALPYLFTVEHVVLKDGETSDQLIKTHWIHDHEGDEVLQRVGNSNIIVQLAAWLPRGSSSRASPADKACCLIAATAIEKLAGKEGLRMGPYQLVLWQPRYVFADLDGLHYQKLSTQNRPMGKPKKITFASILEVTELEQGEIVIRCRSRDYTFKAPDASKASVMVHNLRQLILRHAEASGETGEQEGADSS